MKKDKTCLNSNFTWERVEIKKTENKKNDKEAKRSNRIGLKVS